MSSDAELTHLEKPSLWCQTLHCCLVFFPSPLWSQNASVAGNALPIKKYQSNRNELRCHLVFCSQGLNASSSQLSWCSCNVQAEQCVHLALLSFSLSFSSPSHTISVFLSSEGLSHSHSHWHHSFLPSSHPLDSLPPTLSCSLFAHCSVLSPHAASSGYSSSHTRLYLSRKRKSEKERLGRRMDPFSLSLTY